MYIGKPPKNNPGVQQSVQEGAVQDFSSQQNSLRLRKSVWNEDTDLQLMWSETKNMRSGAHDISQGYGPELREE